MWTSSQCGSILNMRNGLGIQSEAYSHPVPQMECKSNSKSPMILKNPNPVLPNYGFVWCMTL